MVVCQVCDQEFKRLGVHLNAKHDMTTKQYREEYNAPTIDDSTKQKISENMDREAISKHQRKRFEDEKEKQAHSERIKESWEDRDNQAHAEQMRKLSNEGVVLPEEKVDREAIGQRQKELWQDEEYRQKQKEAGNAFLSENAWNEGMSREELIEMMGEERYKEWQQARRQGQKKYFENNPQEKWERDRKFIMAPVAASQTSLEASMEELLKDMSVSYEKEVMVKQDDERWVVDFVIEGELLLMVDGCFWHVCPDCFPDGPTEDVQERNVHKDESFAEAFDEDEYLRIWECQMDENVQEQVRQKLSA